jgi:endonuclease/exonuclease/phosphatase family metal-dependent hydrolase
LSEGIGLTHPDWVPILRIDYVFGTGEWERVSAKRIPTTISDHYPVIVVAKAKSASGSQVQDSRPD